MAASWVSYLVEPLHLVGAGRIFVRMREDSVGEIEAVRALVGPAAAAGPDDPTCQAVELSIRTSGCMEGSGVFLGAPEVAVVSFFHMAGGAWLAGPAIPNVPLAHDYSNVAFPWPKDWIVSEFQRLADHNNPLGPDRRLRVTGAFPRDPSTWPAITVQVDSIATSQLSVADLLKRGIYPNDGVNRGRCYGITLSAILWAGTPEDRDQIAPWMGGALEILTDIARVLGLQEPTFTLEESEDFETLKVPLFIVTARISGSAWSTRAHRVGTTIGHLTV